VLKDKVQTKKYTSMLVAPIIIILIGFPLGMCYGDVPQSELEGLGPYIAWLMNIPVIYILSIMCNFLLFFCVLYTKKLVKKEKSPNFLTCFSVGMFFPILINICFWANANTIAKAMAKGKPFWIWY